MTRSGVVWSLAALVGLYLFGTEVRGVPLELMLGAIVTLIAIVGLARLVWEP